MVQSILCSESIPETASGNIMISTSVILIHFIQIIALYSAKLLVSSDDRSMGLDIFFFQESACHKTAHNGCAENVNTGSV